MGKHKVIAIRIRGKGDNLVVESLGQAPRGTRFIIDTIKIDTKGLSKGQLKKQVEEAAYKIIPVPLPFD